MNQSKVIAVDFNRTLVGEGGPDPTAWGPPTEGAVEAMKRLKDQGFVIAINSVVGDRDALRGWLDRHQVPYDHVNESPAQPEGSSCKLNAVAYIDDRAVPFRGDWEETLKDLFDSGVLTKRYKSRIPGGLAESRSPNDFDQAALDEGTKVEMEHTNDPEIAREIAMDHLVEDPSYYEKGLVDNLLRKPDIGVRRIMGQWWVVQGDEPDYRIGGMDSEDEAERRAILEAQKEGVRYVETKKSLGTLLDDPDFEVLVQLHRNGDDMAPAAGDVRRVLARRHDMSTDAVDAHAAVRKNKGATLRAALEELTDGQLRGFYQRYLRGNADADRQVMIDDLADDSRVSTVLFGVPGKRKAVLNFGKFTIDGRDYHDTADIKREFGQDFLDKLAHEVLIGHVQGRLYGKEWTKVVSGLREMKMADDAGPTEEDADAFIEALSAQKERWDGIKADPVLKQLVEAGILGFSPLTEIPDARKTKEPCKPGQTAARTGCTPRQKPQPKPRAPKADPDEVEAELSTAIKEGLTKEKIKALGEKIASMTVVQIRQMRDNLGIKVPKYGPKAELVKRIKAQAKEKVEQAKRERIAATLERVNEKIDKFQSLFSSRGQHEVSGWLQRIRDHVNEVGVEEALGSLDAEKTGEGRDNVVYVGESGGYEDMSDFAEQYLNRNGITMIQQLPGQFPLPHETLISSQAPSAAEYGNKDVYMKGDFAPKDPTFKDKLEESQHLPGLESSADLSELIGEPVTALTPDVMSKLDDEYGKDGWIVKSYGDEAYAGFGIFFPQRARQLQKEAQDTIWNAGSDLDRYGFKVHRNEEGTADGIVHESGDVYKFGSRRYNNTIDGHAREVADRVAEAAHSERGAFLPNRDDIEAKYMVQPAFKVVGISDAERAAGMTIKKGQEGRVHIVTRNGKAELVPHSTWLKETDLPVVFENDDTRAMAQAAVDAINALPESERQGQIYAPDIIPTEDGYKVVEANPANASGSSGYLGDNPFIIDSYVSQLTGREPAHVRFIKQLLTQNAPRKKKPKRWTKTAAGFVKSDDPKPDRYYDYVTREGREGFRDVDRAVEQLLAMTPEQRRQLEQALLDPRNHPANNPRQQ